MGDRRVVYVSGQEAARRLRVAPITVSRVAKRHGIGVLVEDGRLAALSMNDIAALKHFIQPTPGNPKWIKRRQA